MWLLQSLPEPPASLSQTGDAYSVEHLIEAADNGTIVYITGCCPAIAVEWWGGACKQGKDEISLLPVCAATARCRGVMLSIHCGKRIPWRLHV